MGRELLLKQQVKAYWEHEPCDIRYGRSSDPLHCFNEVQRKRYELEPIILDFANFSRGEGRRVLEIGIGIGVDFSNWLTHKASATGVDITSAAVELTRKHLDLQRLPRSAYRLSQTDAENLPFQESSFDIVYSWGVLHHTPRTELAFKEVFRVLSPGGTLKAMVYHVPSWTGWLLWLRHGLLKGDLHVSIKEIISRYLESPGTKAYTSGEICQLLAEIGFGDISTKTALGPSDLLRIDFSDKYHSFVYQVAKIIYPRWLVKMTGNKYGLLLLVEAQKPATVSRMLK